MLKGKGITKHSLVFAPIAGDNTNLTQTLSDPLPVSAANNYNYLLPSFTARLNLTEELVARVAGSRTLTKPPLSDPRLCGSDPTRPPQPVFLNGKGNPHLSHQLASDCGSRPAYYL